MPDSYRPNLVPTFFDDPSDSLGSPAGAVDDRKPGGERYGAAPEEAVETRVDDDAVQLPLSPSIVSIAALS